MPVHQARFPGRAAEGCGLSADAGRKTALSAHAGSSTAFSERRNEAEERETLPR